MAGSTIWRGEGRRESYQMDGNPKTPSNAVSKSAASLSPGSRMKRSASQHRRADPSDKNKI